MTTVPKVVRVDCHTCGGRGRFDRPNPLWLRTARRNAGLTLRQFARKAGFSAAFISDVELGRRNCSYVLLGRYEKLRDGA